MSKSVNSKKVTIWILLCVFYILPPTAIVLNLIPFNLRFLLLTAITPILFFIRPKPRPQNQELGLSLNHLRESIFGAIPITIILSITTISSALILQTRYDNSNLSLGFYLFYIFISCPFQEFAYRGYLFPLFDRLDLGKWAKITIAALMYSFVHIIYMDFYLLLATFITGILWNINYDKYRNLAGVTLSHIILGVLTIALGLI